MEKLTINLLSEILTYLNVAHHFQLKTLNSKLRSKIDDSHAILIKRDAFLTFTPDILEKRNPFV